MHIKLYKFRLNNWPLELPAAAAAAAAVAAAAAATVAAAAALRDFQRIDFLVAGICL